MSGRTKAGNETSRRGTEKGGRLGFPYLRADDTGLVPTKKQGRLPGRLEVGHSLSRRGVSELLRQHRGVSVVKAADGCVFRHVFVVQEVG